jgi:ABC-type nickel/cobalt efflux system permease component RcnA
MTGWSALLGLGLLLGVRHALDPDHVIAVGTISARAPSLRRSMGVGALWGLGHTLTILLFGGAMVILRAAISPRAGLAMEFAVALMLITLGVLNLLNARHPEPAAPSTIRPFIIGMVHGTAGSAAIALLILATIDEPAAGMLYLLLFGAGTIAGMIAVTGLMTIPMTMIADRAVGRRWLTAASGLVSLAFGVFMVHALGGPLALFAAGPSL